MRNTIKILANLRALMKNLPNEGGSISAYIIPADDCHQSEYINETDERRSFVSGFDGSAGTAVVTQKEALLWTDGRYFQQAEKQLDKNWTLMRDRLPTTPSINDWLVKNLSTGDKVGVDGRLVSYREWSPLATALDSHGMSLRSITPNLVDLVWKEQPPRKFNPILALSLDITGQTIGQKVEKIRAEMAERGCNVLAVTALDEVAWLLNMRGSDIAYNPVFFGYVILTFDQIHVFLDKTQLPSNFKDHFHSNNVDVAIEKYETVEQVLKSLVSDVKTTRVWISSTSSYALSALVPFKRLVHEITPICLMKAIKNETEANGMVECHIRDGIALCKYFAWLEAAVQNGEYVDEITGATKLEQFRQQLPKFKGLSFPTINASGPNGSIIHYHPKEETKRQITTTDMYLCDSGAQFLDGTTDVTRTWHFGNPTEHQIDCNSRVLKGQISLATAVFPNKTKGSFLDTLARKALWDVGLDYLHGTGHGIGHFLNVHEGPMGISCYRTMPDDPGLQTNMFVSNEPGYYEDGQFGIRIEDIVQIVPATAKYDFAGRGALTFKTVTMCPIQTKLINPALLTEKEKNHLNEYHLKVRKTIGPLLQAEGDKFTYDWLLKETNPIS